MNIFYGFIVILIFQQFLWLLVTLDSGNMAERLRFLPQKHWGENKNYQNHQVIQNTKHKIQNTKYKTQNTKHKIQKTKYKTQNTKFLYLREVRRQRWYCKVTPSDERRSKSLVISIYDWGKDHQNIRPFYMYQILQKREIRITSRKFIIWNPPPPIPVMPRTSYSPFFGETLKNREGPPLLWGPRIFDLIHFAHGRFCPYLPTMVGQRTLWTGGRFCPLTARGLKIAPQGENSAGRPHPDRWTRGHKYR